MVVICSLSWERNSFSPKDFSPCRLTTVARCAFFSSTLAAACSCFCFSSERCGRSVDCAIAPAVERATPSKTMERRRILTKANKIFNHTPEATAYIQVSHKHKLIVYLKTRRRLLLPSAGINLTDIDIETIKNGTVIRILAGLENFSVKLLHEEHGGS